MPISNFAKQKLLRQSHNPTRLMIRIAKAQIHSFKDPFRPPAIHLQTAVQETQCFQGLLGKLLDVLTASQCKKHPTPENTPNQTIFGASLMLVGLQLASSRNSNTLGAHSPRTTRNRILTSDYQNMNGCKHGGSDPKIKAQWLANETHMASKKGRVDALRSWRALCGATFHH